MLRVLVALLILVPTIEIWGLLTSSHFIGWFPTLLLCIFTGVLGAWLAKRQGLQVFYQAAQQIQHGKMPGEAILDGIIIFAGGLVLLTPGFFTDILGFLCLIPYTRHFLKLLLKKWLYRAMQNGRFTIFHSNRWNRF